MPEIIRGLGNFGINRKTMNKRTLILGMLFASVLGGLIAVGSYKLFENKQPATIPVQSSSNVHFSNFLQDSSFIVPEGLNFVYAAELVTPCVVHIKSTRSVSAGNEGYSHPLEEWFRDYFGDPRDYNQQQKPQQAAGSGVIISADGYIATNNHVIDNSEELEVTLHDNRSYPAKLIGSDPNTDIALIKIEVENLPFVEYGNSDNVKVGEWVLAVGNPFDLTSTVTAGIVSAKGRNINILRERYGIESFIQTDAAVNPGNSGGALVNLKGQLIGINTAIATPTGSYAGYSFAVPVSLVKKVVEDLKEFGIVQRAVLGIEIMNVNDPRIEDKPDVLSGVYVSKVNEGSAAEEAGLKSGDIIIKINKKDVTNVAELQDHVARNRPGDKINVTFKRDGDVKTVNATLKNLDNEIKIVKKTDEVELQGATMRNPTEEELEAYEVESGVIIEDISAGKWKEAGVRKGFLIISINNNPIKNVEQLKSYLRNIRNDGILIKGKYADGKEAYYGMGW